MDLKIKMVAIIIGLLILGSLSIFLLTTERFVGKSFYSNVPERSFPLKAYECVDLHPKETNDYYVDGESICGECSDDNPGTVTEPWCTFERAFKASLTPHLERSGKLYLREGTYRFDSGAFGSELSIYLNISGTAANPTIISGYPGEKPMIFLSDQVQGWERYAERPDENIWMIDWKGYLQQNHDFQYRYPYAEGTRAPQLVAIDEDPILLFQEINSLKNGWTWYTIPQNHWVDSRFPSNTSSVGTDQADMDQGTAPTFYYESTQSDPDFGKLFIWLPDGTNPNNRKIEVSVSPAMPFAFADRPMSHIHIKNLGVRFAGGHFGAIILSGSNNRFENIDSSYNAVTGLTGICKNCLVKNSILSFNGNAGAGLYGENTVYESNILEGNNWRKYARYEHAGGIKFVENVAPDGRVIGTPKGMVFRKNLVKENDGYGIWFDNTNVENVFVEGNVIVNNSLTGIFVEISRGTAEKPIRVRDNILVNNGHGKFGEKRYFDGGGLISGSRNVLFENNLIYDSPGGVTERVAGPLYPLQQNTLRNNIFLNVSFPITIQREDAATGTGSNTAYQNIFMNPDHSSFWEVTFAYWDDPTNPDHRPWIELKERFKQQMIFCYGWCFDWEGNAKNFTQWQALGFDQNSAMKRPRAIDVYRFGPSTKRVPTHAKEIIFDVREYLTK